MAQPTPASPGPQAPRRAARPRAAAARAGDLHHPDRSIPRSSRPPAVLMLNPASGLPWPIRFPGDEPGDVGGVVAVSQHVARIDQEHGERVQLLRAVPGSEPGIPRPPGANVRKHGGTRRSSGWGRVAAGPSAFAPAGQGGVAPPSISRPTPVNGAEIWSAAARRRFGLPEREPPPKGRCAPAVSAVGAGLGGGPAPEPRRDRPRRPRRCRAAVLRISAAWCGGVEEGGGERGRHRAPANLNPVIPNRPFLPLPPPSTPPCHQPSNQSR